MMYDDTTTVYRLVSGLLHAVYTAQNLLSYRLEQ